jgi:hypothetical protein
MCIVLPTNIISAKQETKVLWFFNVLTSLNMLFAVEVDNEFNNRRVK